MPSTTNFTYHRLSRNTQEPTLDSEGVITMELLVEKTPLSGAPTQILNPDDIRQMREEGVIPWTGALFPAASTATWEKAARFRSYTAEFVDGGYALRVGLRWTTRYTIDAATFIPGNPASGDVVLPVMVEYVTRTRTLNLYRASWITAPPSGSDATGADIGGTSLRQQDQGSTQQIPQVGVRMRYWLDATAVAMNTAAATLSSYAGYKNSATFLGFPANTLICEGISISDAQDEFYEVVFEFLYDYFYHHEQVPICDADGKPKRTAAGELSDVRWKRLPRSSVDFNLIFGGDARFQARAETGWFT